MLEEKVVCIKHNDVPTLISYLNDTTSKEPAYQILPRKIAEYSKEFAHLIVYLVIKINNKFLCYQRVSEDEKRLDGNIAFFGGHINIDDMQLKSNLIDYINVALVRELNEELGSELANIVLTGQNLINYDHHYLGLIYSTETEVDSVHIGYCYSYSFDLDNLEIINSNPKLKLIEKAELEALAKAGKTDNWIKIVLNMIKA